MILDELGHDAPVPVQCAERAFLIRTHEPAVAGHIGGQNRCKAALNLTGAHGVRRSSRYDGIVAKRLVQARYCIILQKSRYWHKADSVTQAAR
jgi:hypothetical protein